MGVRHDAHMRTSDAFSWYMERDPLLRSTIVTVLRLDRPPDRDVVVDRTDRLTRRLPMFRQRVVEPPLRLSTPRWTYDPDFDLSWHLRSVRLDGWDDVMALARRAAMTAFDPAHPLWETTLVSGLPDGEAAVVMKIHHALTDGIGGMQMALLLFDLERDPPPPEPLPDAPPGEELDRVEIVRDALVDDWHRAAAAARDAARGLVPAVGQLLRHPVRRSGEVLETVRSVARLVRPVSDTRSPVMTGRHLGRELATLDVALADLRDAAATAGGTVNDAFMASVTGGLRRYHERHGASVDTLRVTLPISIRTSDDPIGGNRITLQRLEVAAGEPDPRARMQHLHEVCHRARAERSLPYTGAVAGALNLVPRGYVAGMLKHVDFLASNVPGFTFPVYLAGAEVLAYYPFGPTIGASVNVTLLSYRDACCVGVTIDTAAVPDPDVLVECLREGFDEVASVGLELGEEAGSEP